MEISESNFCDLTQTPRNVLVIDLFGLSEQEVSERHPAIYQWVYERIKPEREVLREVCVSRRRGD